MNQQEYPTYSDETLTGQASNAFRGLGRATVAARVEDPNGFEWLLRFRRDHLPERTEPKAPLVLEIMEVNAAARTDILKHIGRATIVIIDLGESYRSLLADVFEHFGKPPPSRIEAIDFVAKAELRRDLSAALLTAARDSAVHDSIIPRIEGLLRDVVRQTGIPRGESGFLIDREALGRMDQKAFQEFVARFSAAFADALAPERRRAAIVQALDEQRFLMPGYIAFETLGGTVRVDRYFDVGDADAFENLLEAHDTLVDTLKSAQERFFWKELRGGTLKQEDSAQLLGIQAADIAARIASIQYERFPHDRRAGAISVKSIFDQVLLNDQWM